MTTPAPLASTCTEFLRKIRKRPKMPLKYQRIFCTIVLRCDVCRCVWCQSTLCRLRGSCDPPRLPLFCFPVGYYITSGFFMQYFMTIFCRLLWRFAFFMIPFAFHDGIALAARAAYPAGAPFLFFQKKKRGKEKKTGGIPPWTPSPASRGIF